MQEKDAKLKTQISKNQELLSELKELSEAVHALKNDKSFTHSAEILEEREAVIRDLEVFITDRCTRHSDVVFSSINKNFEQIQDFMKTYSFD